MVGEGYPHDSTVEACPRTHDHRQPPCVSVKLQPQVAAESVTLPPSGHNLDGLSSLSSLECSCFEPALPLFGRASLAIIESSSRSLQGQRQITVLYGWVVVGAVI